MNEHQDEMHLSHVHASSTDACIPSASEELCMSVLSKPVTAVSTIRCNCDNFHNT